MKGNKLFIFESGALPRILEINTRSKYHSTNPKQYAPYGINALIMESNIVFESETVFGIVQKLQSSGYAIYALVSGKYEVCDKDNINNAVCILIPLYNGSLSPIYWFSHIKNDMAYFDNGNSVSAGFLDMPMNQTHTPTKKRAK